MHTDAAHETVLSHLHTMREIIVDTMLLMLKRRTLRPDYRWIDLKLDALTGTDHFSIPGIRDKDHVYSWIQGRGLEAIATHVHWFSQFSGYPAIDTDALIGLGHDVAQNLEQARKVSGGHLRFLIESKTDSGRDSDVRYTMSDLFCARGLYAFHHYHGSKVQKSAAKEYLKQVIDAILSGNFHNDQISFNESQYKPYADGRTSYAGQMLALGAVSLLMRLERDSDAPALGRSLVESVLAKHVNVGRRWISVDEDTLLEWIDPDGKPSRDENGRILLDPGHALEFVGLAGQMLRFMYSSYPEEAIDSQWMEKTKLLLMRLLKVNLAYGYREPGGIAKGVDAENREAIHDTMPWWSLPETLRAIALVEELNGCARWSEWGLKWFDTCMQSFSRNFRVPSACKIPVQTIDANGRPIAVIPATPDLDPGYHTGLSLIDCYDVLAKKSPLAMDAIEVDITPQVGTRLSGHAARNMPSEAVLDNLYARISLLESPYCRCALVVADLLELSIGTVEEIREALASPLGVETSHIIVSTTHTHTAPPVIDLGVLEADREYMEHVKCMLIEAARRVGPRLSPVTLDTVTFEVPVGINRRNRDPKTQKIQMRPNPAGSRDDEVVASIFRDMAGNIRSVWIQTAVHPTTLAVSVAAVSADYPGSIARHLKREFGSHVVVVPLTGACGDVRPALLGPDGSSFREGTIEDVEHMGAEIAGRLFDSLQEKAGRRGETENHMCFVRRTISCRFGSIPSREELIALQKDNAEQLARAQKEAEDLEPFVRLHDNPVWEVEAQRHWIDRLLRLSQIPESVEAELSVLSIGNAVTLCMVPGELFSDPGKRIKALFARTPVMLVGYANGSLGYLPGEDACDEGGYEVAVAYKYYGLPGPFDSSLEQLIWEGFSSMAKEVQHD